MRIVVFFDLPVVTHKGLVEYRKFHNFLIKNGFIMMQESVYSRLVINRNSLALVRKKVKDNLPTGGNIQLLEITEKQYASIEYLRGNAQKKVIDTEDRVIEIWNL